jgi:hypothetical protein
MSLAENLLNSLDETAYANTRIAGGGIEEEHIVVNASRTITVPANLKTIAVEGDKDIETVTFDCIRYWDGYDLSTFAIYIAYVLPNGEEGTYIPTISAINKDTFSFMWTLGSEITRHKGSLSISIIAQKTDDSGNLLQQWSSFVNNELSILDGLEVSQIIEDDTTTNVTSQILQQIDTLQIDMIELKADFASYKSKIDSALDSILAIQEALMPKLPTFTLNSGGDILTYEFEEGMTWGEWMTSKYCTVPNDWTLVSFDAVNYKNLFVYTDNGYQDIVYANYNIESGHEYFTD